ncbi:bifunctional diguanylate cyclase/phosphodiesterase [Niallia nealsonii]|uniref:GGDEF domain-containing protein n=1 Tax=Niallia nealsonii TaxID=115979 RepID=A0A2N0Z1S8_9BACI|nr:bifunctional diguanylate cyclase/phosphodiesterase [Niallia nealsonii]PKG23449.1 GGDEF domain-containing protein [Niallia nealsonii]
MTNSYIKSICDYLMKDSLLGFFYVENGKFHYSNNRFEEIYGYNKKELMKMNLIELIYADDRDIISKTNELHLEDEVRKDINIVLRGIKKSREIIYTEIHGVKKQINDFSIVFFGTIRQLNENEVNNNRIETVLESITDGFFSLDYDLKIKYVNNATEKLLNVKRENIIGTPIYEALPNSDIDNFVKRYKRSLLSLKPITFEELFNNRWYDVRAFPSTERLSVYFRDITEQKEENQKMHFMAYYDSLTKLPNRNYFKDYISSKLLTDGEQIPFAILFIDLERFKIVNDTFGHAIGDLLLQQVSERLSECVKAEGIVARFSGDEFLILLENATKNEILFHIKRIIDSFSEPFLIKEHEVFTSPSIGVSQYPKNGQSLETLIKHADIAMYHAKKNWNDNFTFFNQNLSDYYTRKANIENHLRKSLMMEQLQVHYQPIIELDSGKIFGLEALVRWEHPKMGIISPEEFIPIAEETGLIIDLGNYVLQKACKQLKIWQESDFDLIHVSVNISTRQLEHNQFVENVIKVLKETKLNPMHLELEVTESIVQNIKHSQKILNELKNIGVNLSIDDFGTGYSSLNILHHLPIDKLKIDKTFINDINTNDYALVKTIIEMGHNLNFSLIAEGIENEQQLNLLKQYKCQYGQGYYFSKPLPANEIEKLLLKKK